MENTLEKIIDEILKHDQENPSHGVGCACHDRHAGMIRQLLSEKDLYFPINNKSMRNFLVVIGYIARNP